MIKSNLNKYLILKLKRLSQSKLHYIIFKLIFLYNFSYSQEIELKNVFGTAIIYGNTSPNDAKIEAINNAKFNALKKAGIEESIKSYQALYTSQINNDFNQFFTSDIQSEMKGVVKSFEVVSEKIKATKENELLFEIEINCTVTRYLTSPDYL